MSPRSRRPLLHESDEQEVTVSRNSRREYLAHNPFTVLLPVNLLYAGDCFCHKSTRETSSPTRPGNSQPPILVYPSSSLPVPVRDPYSYLLCMMVGASSITASSDSSPAHEQPSRPCLDIRGVVRRVHKGATVAVKHVVKHTGTGIICSVAYFDP